MASISVLPTSLGAVQELAAGHCPDRGFRARRAPDHIYQSPSQVTFIPKQRHNEMTVTVDFIIAPRKQLGTPINFIEKEQQWLMNFHRDLVSCINKISRKDKNYKRAAMPRKLSPNEVF